jgi:hypothetical protein
MGIVNGNVTLPDLDGELGAVPLAPSEREPRAYGARGALA